MVSKYPILHYIDEIKTKLGFDRTMTAPGNDVVDAINKIYAGGFDLKAWAENSTDIAAHRNTFGGRNLGSTFTAEQKANIANNFKGFLTGDYWEINGAKHRIVDFSYFYNHGDTALTKPHLVIMPDLVMYNQRMHSSNDITSVGYAGCEMRTSGLDSAKATITAFFGSVISHREYLQTAVNSTGKPSGGAWTDCTVEIPTESMLFGNRIFSVANDGTVPNLYTNGKLQFALFQLAPEFLNTRQHIWERDIVSGANFALVDDSGLAGYTLASYTSLGVRPYYLVGAE